MILWGKWVIKLRIKDAFKLFIVIAVVAGALFLLLFFGLREKKSVIHSGEYTSQAITDTKTGINYTRCPAGIGANNLEELYLQCGENGPEFYSIRFESPRRFLSEPLNAFGGAFVYRAESEPEITLSLFAPVSAKIFMEDEWVDSFYAENVDGGEGFAYVKMITDAFKSPVEATPTGAYDEAWFSIRLYSENYPGLYYEISFITDINGVSYLNDEVTDTLVPAPDELTLRMIG